MLGTFGSGIIHTITDWVCLKTVKICGVPVLDKKDPEGMFVFVISFYL